MSDATRDDDGINVLPNSAKGWLHPTRRQSRHSSNRMRRMSQRSGLRRGDVNVVMD